MGNLTLQIEELDLYACAQRGGAPKGMNTHSFHLRTLRAWASKLRIIFEM